jgi:hypothetical protein
MGADRIQSGGLTAGQDAIDSPGSLIVDSLNGTLGIVTNTHQISIAQVISALFGPQTALTAITTAQNLLTKAFAAGELNVAGRTLQISGKGIYSSAGGSTPTISIALTLGGVTLATLTSSAINTAANTNLQFNFTFNVSVVSVGTSGTLVTTGVLNINLSANTPGAALTQFADQNTGVSSAVNLTTAETLAVTIAASAAVASAQLQLGSVQILS